VKGYRRSTTKLYRTNMRVEQEWVWIDPLPGEWVPVEDARDGGWLLRRRS
jgi:hypothetical protein